jgi:hypothetical protein
MALIEIEKRVFRPYVLTRIFHMLIAPYIGFARNYLKKSGVSVVAGDLKQPLMGSIDKQGCMPIYEISGLDHSLLCI